MGVNEVMQIFGRAGRPKYDTEGRALIIAANMERMKELYRDYIIAKPEAIDSALGVVPVLRSHVLSLIATNFVSTKESMNSFFSKTFYGLQYNSMSHIHRVIDEVLHDLKRWEMVKEDDRSYVATKLGSRVSELYIDPLSAKWMVDSISNVSDSLDALFMISNTLEMRPYVRVTADAEGRYAAYLHTHKKLMLREFDPMDYGNYEPEGAFSTALMLNDWAEEMKEPEIVEKYSSTPGALYTKITNADWLIYSAIELSKILKMPHRKLLEMRVRLRYGIKEELLDLVRLQQIGRARARTLYMNGIRSVNDVRNNRAKVTSLLGKETADKVLSQV
jgi:helicase